MKKSLLTVLLSIIVFLSLFAQVNEKRIYVLDGTASLVGFGGAPNVWGKVQAPLIKNIEDVNEAKAEVVLFVFADKIYNKIDGKDNIINFLKNFTPDHIKYTNIHSGWAEIKNHIDPSKFNFVTFLTDGDHNMPSVSQNELENIIIESNTFFGRTNTFACFVRLTNNAIQPKITAIFDQSENISYLDGIKFPVIVRLKQNPIIVNIRDQKMIEEILFFDVFNEIDLPKNFNLTVSLQDELGSQLKLNQSSFEISKGSNSFKIPIEPIGGIQSVPTETITKAKLVLGKEDPNIILINPEIPLSIINKPERFATIDINPNLGNFNNYPSFLFWKEKVDTVKHSIKIQWSEDAKAANSEITLSFLFEGLNNDQFGIIYYNQVMKNNSIVLDPTISDLEIGVFMDQTAPSGKKHGQITLVGTRLDRSNIDDPLDIQLKFSHDWNPLKTIFLWLGIATLGVLSIWFFILRNIYYKKFSKTSIIISDPYFKKINLYGGRMVVFSHRPTKQNILSRILKGTVINEVNPIWEKPITFYPGKNKSFPIKSFLNTDYTLDPYAANLEKYKDYVLSSPSQKIKLNIN